MREEERRREKKREKREKQREKERKGGKGEKRKKREKERKRGKKREIERKRETKISRVNYYQSAFNSQKEKLNILAEMLKISKTGLDLQQHTFTIRAPVGANKRWPFHREKAQSTRNIKYKVQCGAKQCSGEREVGVSQGRISMRAVAATLLQPVSNYFLNNSQLFLRLFRNYFFSIFECGLQLKHYCSPSASIS